MRFKFNAYSLLIIVFIGTAALSAGISQAYWGYVFAPPSVEQVLLPMHTVTQHGFYTMFRDDAGELKLVSASEHTATWGWDDSLQERVPNALHQRVAEVRTSTYFVEREDIAIAADLVDNSDWAFYAPDIRITGYQDRYRACLTNMQNAYVGCYRMPTVRVITGASERGTPLMFIAATSTNGIYGVDDHYFYYEGLWEQQPNGDFIQVREQQFQFDIAGIEGFTFLPIFVTLSAVLMFIGLSGAVIIVLYRSMQRIVFGKRKRKQQR